MKYGLIRNNDNDDNNKNNILNWWLSFYSKCLSFALAHAWRCRCLPDNLYCVGGDVKPCSIQSGVAGSAYRGAYFTNGCYCAGIWADFKWVLTTEAFEIIMQWNWSQMPQYPLKISSNACAVAPSGKLSTPVSWARDIIRAPLSLHACDCRINNALIQFVPRCHNTQ